MTASPSSVSTILIIDDEHATFKLLLDVLDQERFRVLVSSDGASALQQLTTSRMTPDLILLDVRMPGLNGFELCRRLKAHDATRDIPVLFMTALSDIKQKVEGFAAGAVDYITKPFQVEEVLARINAHLTIRRQQQIIAAQNAELHALNAQKDKFVSILAHDIRNPLSGFAGFATLLENDFDRMPPDKRQELIRHFRDSNDMLLALLEHLLSWARLQNGTFECVLEHFALDIVVQRAVTLLTPNAAQKQITLTSAVPAMTAYADLNMTHAVVRNLLHNAIKFTPEGGTVTISATSSERGACVTVADTGIGIPPEKRDTLFQIDSTTQRPGTAGEQGTGLGLILCKEFVERQGGRIAVESEAGNGTRVTFTLPAHAAASE